MAGVEELRDVVTLKRDGRRISLEGVLTGAALGILLLYMLDEAVAASVGSSRGGPIEDPSDVELGTFRTAVGAIAVAPLDEIDLGPVGSRSSPPGGGEDPQKAGGGDGSAPPLGAGRGGPQGLAPIADLPTKGSPDGLSSGAGRGGLARGGGASGVGVFGQALIASTGFSGGQGPGQKPPTDPGGGPDIPFPPIARELPEVLLVLVRTHTSVSGRSLEGKAMSIQTLNQRGVENSRLNFVKAGGTNFEVVSERDLQGSGASELDDATIELITANATITATELLGGPVGDLFVLGARDFITLALSTNASGSANLNSWANAIGSTKILDESGNNFVSLQANLQLNFLALGDPKRAGLAFDLLTQGMRDSLIALGGGDDTVAIVSGYRDGLGTIDIGSATDIAAPQTAGSGIRFDLPEELRDLSQGQAWDFELKAVAIGVQDSSITTGAGNDEVTIYARIDDSLKEDLGPLYDHPSTMIVRERIGLLRSDLNVGPGDDIVKINGAVVASTIDLGEGNNILILEGAVDQDSRILAGSGNNRIQINGSLGSDIIGGSGDDVFTLSSLQLAGLVDGGGGNDLLVTGAGDQRDLAVIQGPDQGFLRGLRFASIEGLDLGGGDDVALLGLDGTLSGQLLGGNGLDRLQFNNWELPVTVDLDLGSATAIYGGARGGISGFEQVYGGIGNDVLAASGFFSGLDGNEGDDILYLRWTPWLSQPGRRLELEGGGGSDLVVIVGLEQPIPLGWDGVSGIPVLTDLHLNRFNNDKTDTDSVGWLRQVVGQDGTVSQTFIRLTPSSVEGLGDVKLLPIAPLEQLLSGMADGTKQLAIALDPSQPMAAGELHLLGSQGQGTSRLIAYVPSDVLIPQLGSSPVL